MHCRHGPYKNETIYQTHKNSLSYQIRMYHYSTNLQKLDATKEGYTFSYNVCPVNNIDTIYFSICRTDFEKFVTSFLHVKSMGVNHHHF